MSRPGFTPTPRRALAFWVAAVLAVAVAGLVAPAPSLSATSSTKFDIFAFESPFTGAGARFPERLATADDLTGDGVADVYASSYVIPVAGKANAGTVYLINGANRSVVYSVTEPDPQVGSNFGFYITTPGDLNGDGKGDLLVGASGRPVYTGTGAPCGQPEPNGCNERQGKAYAFSGTSGTLLFSMDNPRPQADGVFGSRLAGAGDVTNDRVPDIIAGASSNDVPTGCGTETTVAADCRKNEGEAFIFDGRNGSLLRSVNVPEADRLPATCTVAPPATSRCGDMGGTVQSPGDIDRDGVADQLIDAYSLKPTPDRSGRMYLFSGRTGTLLARIDQPVPGGTTNSSFWGLQDVENNSPGDLTADGVPDIYVNGFLQPGENGQAGAGRAWVFDGRATVNAGSGVVAYEAKDPDPQASKGYGFTERKTDYNKDGFPDLAITSLSGAATSVAILDGRNGSTLLKTLDQPTADIQRPVMGNPGPTFGQGLAAPGDLNRDGEPDYVVSAHATDINGNQDQGRMYFYVSNVPPVQGPGVTPPGVTPPGVTPPVIKPPTQIVPATPPRVSVAGFTASVAPRRDRRAPYRFTVGGRVLRPGGISAAACKGGRVSVQSKVGNKTISTRRMTLKPDCSYRVSVTFRDRRRLGRGRLTLRVRFLGNARFKPVPARTLSARAG